MNVLISDMSFFSLNNFDFLIFGIIGFSTLFGLVRGFIKSFISLAGWIIAMMIGMKFYFILEPVVGKYITFNLAASVIAGITLFLVSAVIIAIINNVFYIAFEALCGGLLDRSFGLLFGFIRGCLLVSFMFYILLMIMPQLNIKDKKVLHGEESSRSSAEIPSWAKNSETILLLNNGAVFVNEIMPTDFKRKLKQILSPELHAKKEGEEGNVSIEQSNSSDDITNEDSVHIILNLLPKEVINKMSQEDLILLQDNLTSPKEKAKVLEEITKKYQNYINNEENLGENSSEEEIEERNLKYYKLMSMIENQILEYNSK